MALCVFIFIHNRRRKGLFVGLSLEDLFFDCSVEMNRYTKPSIPINTRSTKGIDTHILSSDRLATLEQELVDQPQDSNLKQCQCGKRSGERVLPTGVEENESIGANEIDTTPAGFTAQ